MSPRSTLAPAETAALDGLDAIEAAQVRRCARVLLRRPLLRAEGPDGEALGTVRRYADRLQTLFTAYLGYRLVVEPSFARLYKTGRRPDGVRGARKPNGAPLTPRAYAYLALVLAVLTGGSGQLLLSGLVADVRAAGAEAGLDLGTGIVDRRALAAALRHLVDLGVLTETDGSVAPWADDAAREALLTVDVELLAHLVAVPLSRVASPEALAHAGAESADVRHRVRRRLVEDPVVARSSLTPEERDWLRTHLRSEARLLEELTGMRLEARAEGVLAVDPDGYLTDRAFPGGGTFARIALLAAAELVEEGSRPGIDHGEESPGRGGEVDRDGVAVTRERFDAVVADLAARHPRAWSKDAVRDTDRLASSVLETLTEVGLAVSPPGGLVVVSAAAGRYLPMPDAEEAAPAPDAVALPDPGAADGQEQLFAL
ncbi:hypothetical protein GCM10027294_03790 [Marinactinospora endophytica]